MGWVIAASGAFAICGAVLDLEFFMNHRKAQVFLRLFGRNGTRVFYGLLGSALVVLGLLIALGIIEQSE